MEDRWAASLGAFAIGTAVALLALWLITTILRRGHEARLGVRALAQLKWRDFTQLSLDALSLRGFAALPFDRQLADGGFDFLLQRDGERHLLSCKHGLAYRLGEPAVQELAAAMRLQSAQGGLLLTQGDADSAAQALAERQGIQVIAGRALWEALAPLVDPATRAAIAREAADAAGRRIGFAMLGSLAIALLTYAGLRMAIGDAVPVATSLEVPRTATPVAAPAGPAAAPRAPLDERELAALRLSTVRQIKTLPAIENAEWATSSTLVLSLGKVDAGASDPVQAVCQVLMQHDELRYTRLQMQPSGADGQSVRWDRCQ